MSGTSLALQTIAPADRHYPAALKTCAAFSTAPILFAIGNCELLTLNAIALFCSSQCPSDLVDPTYALAEWLCAAHVPVIGGFHSAIEQACLKILLSGAQPVIHCPARSLHTIRLSAEQQLAISTNRLLLISPFSASHARMTVKLAEKRNEMVATMTHLLFIAAAAPGSKTQALVRRLIQAKKIVCTFNSPPHHLLQEPGIIGLAGNELVEKITSELKISRN